MPYPLSLEEIEAYQKEAAAKQAAEEAQYSRKFGSVLGLVVLAYVRELNEFRADEDAVARAERALTQTLATILASGENTELAIAVIIHLNTQTALKLQALQSSFRIQNTVLSGSELR